MSAVDGDQTGEPVQPGRRQLPGHFPAGAIADQHSPLDVERVEDADHRLRCQPRVRADDHASAATRCADARRPRRTPQGPLRGTQQHHDGALLRAGDADRWRGTRRRWSSSSKALPQATSSGVPADRFRRSLFRKLKLLSALRLPTASTQHAECHSRHSTVCRFAAVNCQLLSAETMVGRRGGARAAPSRRWQRRRGARPTDRPSDPVARRGGPRRRCRRRRRSRPAAPRSPHRSATVAGTSSLSSRPCQWVPNTAPRR